VRHFTYVYEAITSPPGSFDLENWITWRTHAPNDRDFDQIDLRHELEFGITDNLQAAIYVADWNYQNAIGSDGFSYSDSAIELIYNLTNPVIDPLGLSIYQEYSFGERFFCVGIESDRAEKFRAADSRLQRHSGKRLGRKRPA